MKPPALLALILTSAALAADPRGDHPDAKPSTPQEQLKMFHVPPGFEVQLVAAEPEIQKPINLTFDAAGRLWVTGSEMYPWPAGTDAQGKPIPNFAKAYDDIAGAFGARGKAPAPSDKARDTVRVLSDFDETGHARKITVFADGLNIPSGVQPLPRKPGAKGDTALVYSIPAIYRLEDTDGDGRADKREVLYGTAGFLDTHGGMSSFLYWIDGWIYGTHGFRNHSEIRDKTGRLTVLDSGNTYRFRPDGSAFEIYTHGQTNPFGLTVDPLGNFYSADSHSRPVSMLLRGAFYEGIGKQHDGLGFAPRITDDDHGSTAIAGIAYYAAEQFPEEYRGNLFNGNPVTRRLNRAKLEWHGSTPRAIRQPDFLTCDDPWFRPVNVKLGPDGALYIADFYNPIIGHDEFPLADQRRDHTHGRIWRVVWKGEAAAPGSAGLRPVGDGILPSRTSPNSTPKSDATPQEVRRDGTSRPTLQRSALPNLPMPDLTALDAAGLVQKLADPNLIVRTLATNELVDRVGNSFSDTLSSSLRGSLGIHEFINREAGEAFRSRERREQPVQFALRHSYTAKQHALWILERCGAGWASFPLEHPLCIQIARDRPELLGNAHEQLRRESQISSYPRFRSYVEVFAAHPTQLDVTPILTLLSLQMDPSNYSGPPNRLDTELTYACRMALRNILLHSNGYDRISGPTPSLTPSLGDNYESRERQTYQVLAEVSLAVPTPKSADFLLAHLRRTKLQGARSGEFLRHAVLHLPPEKLGAIARLIESVKDAPLPQRLSVADNVAQAYRQRGLPLPDAVATWIQRTRAEAAPKP